MSELVFEPDLGLRVFTFKSFTGVDLSNVSEFEMASGEVIQSRELFCYFARCCSVNTRYVLIIEKSDVSVFWRLFHGKLTM